MLTFSQTVCDRLQGYGNKKNSPGLVCAPVCTWCVCQRQRRILCSHGRHHFLYRQECLTAVKCKIAGVKNCFLKPLSVILSTRFTHLPFTEGTAVAAGDIDTWGIFKRTIGSSGEAWGESRELEIKKKRNQCWLAAQVIEHYKIKSGRLHGARLMDIPLLPKRGVSTLIGKKIINLFKYAGLRAISRLAVINACPAVTVE